MIRVVVADDEMKVCQLICGLIDWKSLDMEIVGVANNGIDAVELIKTLDPDIMITDIRMPGYDGIEMISRGKQIKKEMDFIIISGYKHFEYAQSAIKSGVSDYLLKPIKKNELLDTLNKLHEKYRQRFEKLSSEEQMKIQMQSDIDKLRSGFFTDILLQKMAGHENIEMERICSDYHFKFQQGCFQVLIIKLDYVYEDLHGNNIKVFKDKVSQILRGILKNECFDMEICFLGSRGYCILNYDISNKKIIRKQLKYGLDEILMQKSIFGRVELTIGLGTSEENINLVRNSLRTAEYAVDQRLIIGTGKMIENMPVQVSLLEADTLLADLSKSMGEAIEVLDSNGVIMAIDSLRERVLSKSSLSGRGILRLAMDAFSMYIIFLRNNQFNIDNAEQFQESFSLHADLCSSALQLFSYLSKVIGESINTVIEDKKQADTKPIRTAKQYIQKNYMNPITLKEVSSVAGFNDTYFSSLFKRESGKNFLEYLSEVRMNKAKELLRETSLNIGDICEKVGYSDLKHFTQCFKKFTGLKPNEFRKLYS